LKPGESLGFGLPVVLSVEGLAPAMGSGSVGSIGSSLARSEATDGSVSVSTTLFSRVSVSVKPSIGMYVDSYPQPELFSGPKPNECATNGRLGSSEGVWWCWGGWVTSGKC
jgi:hypothetical protein